MVKHSDITLFTGPFEEDTPSLKNKNEIGLSVIAQIESLAKTGKEAKVSLDGELIVNSKIWQPIEAFEGYYSDFEEIKIENNLIIFKNPKASLDLSWKLEKRQMFIHSGLFLVLDRFDLDLLINGKTCISNWSDFAVRDSFKEFTNRIKALEGIFIEVDEKNTKKKIIDDFFGIPVESFDDKDTLELLENLFIGNEDAKYLFNWIISAKERTTEKK